MGTERVLISPSETKDKEEEEESERVLKLATTTTTTKKFVTSCNKSNNTIPTSFKQSQPKLYNGEIFLPTIQRWQPTCKGGCLKKRTLTTFFFFFFFFFFNYFC
jgi:hypothetical protein